MLASGCAMRLPISTLEPPAIAVGRARTLALYVGEAPGELRGRLADDLRAALAVRGYFSLREVLSPVAPVVEGERLPLDAERVTLAADEALLRLDLAVDASCDAETASLRPATLQSATGELAAVPRLVMMSVGLDKSGRVLMRRCDEEPVVSAAVDVDAVVRAARALLGRLTSGMAPRERVVDVDFDTSDGGQSQILELAAVGNVARAHEELRVYLDGHPLNAAATYNLAVLTHALGRTQAALTLYDRAVGLAHKSLYERARALCAAEAGVELD